MIAYDKGPAISPYRRDQNTQTAETVGHLSPARGPHYGQASLGPELFR